MKLVSKKICLIGDYGVGKTSLIRRFVERQFSDQYLSTVGVKISRKTLQIPGSEASSDRELKLLIWDLEGRQKFKAISPQYLQGASGAIVVADVTRVETLASLVGHIRMFLTVNSTGAIAIAYNKVDLIDESQAADYLSRVHLDGLGQTIPVYLSSAKTGLNVDTIFAQLGERL
ncbi:MAG: Rab family GTPase [Cyanobacteria bacterium P01_D01_bin.123]